MAYRKNVSGQYLYFCLVDLATGDPLTGATVTGKRSIDGGSQATVTGTITEDAGGQYHLALSQADINGNNIGFLFSATGSAMVHLNIVTDGAPQDVNVVKVAGTTQTTGDLIAMLATIAAYIDTEVGAIKTKTDTIDDVMTRANGVETGWTLQETMRIILATLAAKLQTPIAAGSSVGNVVIRNPADTKDRIICPVDANNNRIGPITYDKT